MSSHPINDTISATRMSWLQQLREQGAVITSITADSRKVAAGSLFLAYPGETGDGRDYIPAAIRQGAAAVIWEQQDYTWQHDALPNLAVRGLRAEAGYLADAFYGHPSSRLWAIGITGTNGKTSCSHWLAQTLNRAGHKTAVVGTLGNGLLGHAYAAGAKPDQAIGASAQHGLSAAINTTPDPIALHGMMADYLAQGAQAVAMEVSSHGLQQCRVNGMHFDVALFTNLSRDHLDYHGDMHAYAAAKRKLFDWPDLGYAVVNDDDAYGHQLAQELKQQGRQVLSYGLQSGDVRGSQLQLHSSGMQMQVDTLFGSTSLQVPVVGRFNAYNVLAVLAVLLVSQVPLPDAVAALAILKPVAGRMQQFGGEQSPLVVVDYAHTPDALANALSSLNAQKQAHGGQLICVFGCGGNRDAGKRALMGEVALRLADAVIVTADNPRDESPAAIIDAIVAGMQGPCSGQPEHRATYSVQPDRERAIRLAIAQAKLGDIVLVAGKGHEDYQEIAGVKYPFSDAGVVQQALKELAA